MALRTIAVTCVRCAADYFRFARTKQDDCGLMLCEFSQFTSMTVSARNQCGAASAASGKAAVMRGRPVLCRSGLAFRFRCYALMGLILLASVRLGAVESQPGISVYTEEWPPVSFSDNGRPSGMAVEVVREMLQRAGLKVEIEVVPWARGYKLVTEKPNVILFAVGRTPPREQLMTLIGPLVSVRTEIYQKYGADWKGKAGDALRKAIVGTYRAAFFENLARENGFTHIELAVTPDRSARMLLAGRIDLWVDSNLSAAAIVQVAGGSPADIEPVMTLDVTEMMLGVSRGTPARIVLVLEDALHAMKADGSYQRIHRRWFPGEIPPRHVVRVGVEPR